MEITTIDIKNVCRTCLVASKNLEVIFNVFFEENNSLTKILKSLKIEIDVNDGISNYNNFICSNCKDTALNAYRFQQMCIESDRNLRKILLIENCHKEQEEEYSDRVNIGGAELDAQNICISDSVHEEIEDIIYEDESIDEEEKAEDKIETLIEDANDLSESELNLKSIIYKCSECSKEYKSQIAFKKHLRTHYETTKVLSVGNEIIEGEDSASSNIEDDDDDDDESKVINEYACKECNKVYKRKNILDRHRKFAHGFNKKSHQCDKCSKTFPYSSALIRHEILHSDIVERSRLTRDESQLFMCVICGKDFNFSELLTTHLKAHKGKSAENKSYTCKLCHDNFSTFSDIMRHSKTHIENATHQCTVCNKFLSMGDELIDHFLRHKGMKPHECPVCKKSFLKVHKLNVHMRIHNEEKPFLCPECGKSLSTNENLKRHLIRHSGIKPYACSLCPSRFVFKSGLTSHMSTHTGLKPYVCAVCGSSFTKSSSLTKHNRIHTGERPYVCEVCGFKFNSSDHVKRHMRTHTGERPYRCQYCDRSYAQSNDLLKHTRIHVGENTYKCSICTSAFRLQAQLREHYRIHYDINTLRTTDMIEEEKPQIMEMNMIVDQERCQQQLQFVNNIIKNEQLE